MTPKRYTPPSLRTYGTLAELTAIGGGATIADVFINLTGNPVLVGGVTVLPGQIISGSGSPSGCIDPEDSDLCLDYPV